MNKLKRKNQAGITLIALIITIVVLLILALVTIRAVSDGGIIQHAKTSSDKHKIAQEEEEIRLALSEWKVQSNIPGYEGTFKDFMTQKLSGDNTLVSSVTGEGENLVITMKSTRAYDVTAAGAITLQEVTGGGEQTPSEGGTRLATLAQVGDKVAYTAASGSHVALTSETGYTEDQNFSDYTGEWVVIHNDGTNVAIVNVSPFAPSVNTGNIASLILQGNVAYNNISSATPNVLDKLCSSYAETTFADSARSIRLADYPDWANSQWPVENTLPWMDGLSTLVPEIVSGEDMKMWSWMIGITMEGISYGGPTKVSLDEAYGGTNSTGGVVRAVITLKSIVTTTGKDNNGAWTLTIE